MKKSTQHHLEKMGPLDVLIQHELRNADAIFYPVWMWKTLNVNLWKHLGDPDRICSNLAVMVSLRRLHMRRGGAVGSSIVKNEANWSHGASTECLERRCCTVVANASQRSEGYWAVSRLLKDPSGCLVPIIDWWVPLGWEHVVPKVRSDARDVENIQALSTSML